jgi:hypothetical protein
MPNVAHETRAMGLLRLVQQFKHLRPSRPLKLLTPVTLLPGRWKVATSDRLHGQRGFNLSTRAGDGRFLAAAAAQPRT